MFACIDVSASKLDLVCIDEQGIQLSSSRSLPNNLEGVNTLVQALDSIANNVTKINIGLEATSVYGVLLNGFSSFEALFGRGF
ncbi:IS110 family transposase [Thermosediminibacter oceani]|uniref:IS110 family transposase n=1 Tax=Thermosediminibacter oceani TaxID=291990 RepID=UPI001CB741BE